MNVQIGQNIVTTVILPEPTPGRVVTFKTGTFPVVIGPTPPIRFEVVLASRPEDVGSVSFVDEHGRVTRRLNPEEAQAEGWTMGPD